MAEPRSRADERIVQLAAFRVGTQGYVIDIMRIREIVNPLKITAVPGTSPLIEGVINLRGTIIPMLDLRKRFGIPPDPNLRARKFIILSLERRRVGIIVDEVLEVVRLPRSTLKPAPGTGTRKDRGLVVGMCQWQEQLLLLLDLKRVLEPVLSEMDAPEAGEAAGKD